MPALTSSRYLSVHAKQSDIRTLAILISIVAAPAVAAGAPCPDVDLDGYADCTIAGCDPAGLVCGDCNDRQPAIYPGAVELCDHADTDCDGAVDEGFARLTTCECHHDRFPGAQDYYGWSVAAPGDVDADGTPDFAVGASYDDRTGWDTGMITMYSGRDRRVLWHTKATQSFLNLGYSLAPIADVDGDGVPDLLSGSPGKESIVVISGANGAEIVRCVGPGGGSLGTDHGVASAGDLTGDGVPEIVGGAPTNNERLHHQGKVTVFRYNRTSRACSELFALWDPVGAVYDNLGFAVAGVGDVTGDGTPDIVATEPGYDGVTDSNGGAIVFSGADGSFVRRLLDPAAAWRDNLGADVRGIEDLSGDGTPEIVISTDRRGGWEGELLIFSGADGSLLRRITDTSTTNGERLGWAFDVVDDVDGDGLDDILAGARFALVDGVQQAGRAVVLSSASGAVLGELKNQTNTTSAYFGYAVAGVGDLTGDGITEFLVGAPSQQTSAGIGAGTCSVLALESVCDTDGVSPFGGDCDDTDAAVWRRPTEARDLRFVAGKTALGWASPSDPGTSAPLLYDTLRSASPSMFAVGSCFEVDGTDTSSVDPEAPGAGEALFYLVRAVNGCGDGDLGKGGSLEWPREAPSCP